jgi:glycosyltransferase involved in cell wall biosynthesis
MRITIDCQALQSNNSVNRGIGNYSEDFLTYLLGETRGIEVTLLVNARLSMAKIETLADKIHPSNSLKIREWMPLKSTSWLDGEKIRRQISEYLYSQVLTSTDPDHYLLLSAFEGLSEDIHWIAPPDIECSVIFYDAIPAIFPSRYLAGSEVRDWYQQTALKLRSFSRVLAISKSAALDAQKYLEIESEKINVINFGVIDRYFSVENNAVRGDYVLSVLGEDERKNKHNLLIAWQKVLNVVPEVKLKIVYKQSPPEKINNDRFLRENNLIGRIEFLDYVEQDKLDELFRNCIFTVFPSFYEGLGLPVLESFAHYKPCLVANTSSLVELVNSEDLTFKPDSPEEIASKIVDLLGDNELYEKAVYFGREALNRFSPHNKSKQVQELFNVEMAQRRISPRISVPLLNQVYFYTVLPPTPSGIANYANALIHELHSNSDLIIISEDQETEVHMCIECNSSIPLRDLVGHEEKWVDGNFEIHNLGNSEYHIWQSELMRKYPGLVIMHDGFLSGLVWSIFHKQKNGTGFLERGLLEGSVLGFIENTYMQEPHKLILSEKLNQYFLEWSSMVMVHTHAAKRMIEEDFEVSEPKAIAVIPHFMRTNYPDYGSFQRKKVVGVFGIVAESKMYKEIIEGWNESIVGHSHEYTLRFIGEDVTNDFISLIKDPKRSVKIEHTGYVSDEEYSEHFNEIAFAIQLRRDFRGETSGALSELHSRGIPVLTNIDSWTDKNSETSSLLIDSEITPRSLGEKIDYVARNLDELIQESQGLRERLTIEASPKRVVEQLLSLSSKCVELKKVTPMTQLKFICENYPQIDEKYLGLKEVGEVCLRSFQSVFSKKRIFVLVRDGITESDPNFVKITQNLFVKITKLTSRPVVLCRELGISGYLQTVNGILLNPEYKSLIGNSDYITWLKPGDLLIAAKNSKARNLMDIEVINLVSRELSDFLK